MKAASTTSLGVPKAMTGPTCRQSPEKRTVAPPKGALDRRKSLSMRSKVLLQHIVDNARRRDIDFGREGLINDMSFSY